VALEAEAERMEIGEAERFEMERELRKEEIGSSADVSAGS